MVNRYLKHMHEPIRKKIVKSLLAATALAGVFNTTLQAGHEVYEELTSENILIDIDFPFGNLILKNKDRRTREQIFDDIKTAVLNIEGIEKAYEKGAKLSNAEKKIYLQKIIDTISKEGNISTNNYRPYVAEKENQNGSYIGVTIGKINFKIGRLV